MSKPNRLFVKEFEPSNSTTYGFISWQRLKEECVEFHPRGRRVVRFEIDEDGIHYAVVHKDQNNG